MTSQRKIEANRRNWAKRGPLTEAGRERLRQAALRSRPWLASSGPQTQAGRSRSALNALTHGRESAQRRAFRRLAMEFLRLCSYTGGGGSDAVVNGPERDRLLELSDHLMRAALPELQRP